MKKMFVECLNHTVYFLIYVIMLFFYVIQSWWEMVPKIKKIKIRQRNFLHLTSCSPHELPDSKFFLQNPIFQHQQFTFPSYWNTSSILWRTGDIKNLLCLRAAVRQLLQVFQEQRQDESHTLWLSATSTVPHCETLRNFSGTIRSFFIRTCTTGPNACLAKIKFSDHLLQLAY